MGQMVETTKRRRRLGNKYVWMLSVLAVVSALLYWEQTALLYVLSTLAMCILLLIVAVSDLEGRDRELNQPAEAPDAIRPESNVTTGTSSSALADPPVTKRRNVAV